MTNISRLNQLSEECNATVHEARIRQKVHLRILRWAESLFIGDMGNEENIQLLRHWADQEDCPVGTPDDL